MSSLTPSSTITSTQTSPNGYNWGAAPFNTPSTGGNLSTSNPAIYVNGLNKYAVLGKITSYDGVNANTARFHARVFKNTTDPWTEQDSTNAPQYLNSARIAAALYSWNNNFAVIQLGAVLYVFYFVDSTSIGTSPLAVKTFNMATDTWGTEIQSVIPMQTTSTSALGGRSSGTGLCAALDQSTSKMYIVASDSNISDLVRPGYAVFQSGAWLDTAFNILGHDATVNADETVSTIACTCNGTLQVIFQSQNSDTHINTYFNQAVNPSGSLSTVQSIGITEASVFASGIRCSSSRMLLTPTELVFIYGSLWDGSGFPKINVARASLPGIGVLPTWVLSSVLDLTGLTGSPDFKAWTPFYIPTDGLVIVYTWTWSNNFRSKVGMLQWSGAIWVDDFTPTTSVPLALTNGANVTEDANIEYDFVAPITLIGFPASLGTDWQFLYSLLSNTLRTCPIVTLFPSCPSTNTMFIGTAYSGTLNVSGGNGTYAFTVLN